MTTCPGSGRPWMGGTNAPICPVCHRGPKSLGCPTPRRGGRPRKWVGSVPEHDRRTA